MYLVIIIKCYNLFIHKNGDTAFTLAKKKAEDLKWLNILVIKFSIL